MTGRLTIPLAIIVLIATGIRARAADPNSESAVSLCRAGPKTATMATGCPAQLVADLPNGITCDHVRAVVKEHGEIKAIAMALKAGATLAQIRQARKCLRTAVSG